jgi:endonuclease III
VKLAAVVDALAELYGEPTPPPTTDLFELILWENVAYLVDDSRRARAFLSLRADIGTRPDQIAAASPEALAAVATVGMLPEHQADKLRSAAALVLGEYDGDLETLRGWPLPRARRALRRFPALGEPGADKILLLSRTQPVFALDSNGLRVVQRLGFATEQKSYAASYRSAMAALADHLPRDFDGLIRAHLLLRRHGQELCRRTTPRCSLCPVSADCAYAAARPAAAGSVTPSAARPAAFGGGVRGGRAGKHFASNDSSAR